MLNFSNKVFSLFAICKTESDLYKARLAPTGLVAFPLHDVAVSPESSVVTAACFFSLASVLNFTNISKRSLVFKYVPLKSGWKYEISKTRKGSLITINAPP